jgi:hypothetical protein
MEAFSRFHLTFENEFADLLSQVKDEENAHTVEILNSLTIAFEETYSYLGELVRNMPLDKLERFARVCNFEMFQHLLTLTESEFHEVSLLATKLSEMKQEVRNQMALQESVCVSPKIADFQDILNNCQIVEDSLLQNWAQSINQSTSSVVKGKTQSNLEDVEEHIKELGDNQNQHLVHVIQMLNDLQAQHTQLQDSVNKYQILEQATSRQFDPSLLFDHLVMQLQSLHAINQGRIIEALSEVQSSILKPLTEHFYAQHDSLTVHIDETASRVVDKILVNDQQILEEVKDLRARLDHTQLELQHMGAETGELKQKIQSIQNLQQLFAFNAHSRPLLFIISEERVKAGVINNMIDAANQVVQQGYRLHFLCSVCGKMAQSGRKSSKDNSWTARVKNSLSHVEQDQGGYRFVMTRKWAVKFFKGMEWTLKALKLAGGVGGLMAAPQLLDWIKVLPVPDELVEMSNQMDRELLDITQRLDREALENYWVQHRPKITMAHMKLVRQLLEMVDDANVEDTGLRVCLHPLDGTCAWVCEGDEPSLRCRNPDDSRSCYELYQGEGNDACLIDMEYN